MRTSDETASLTPSARHSSVTARRATGTFPGTAANRTCRGWSGASLTATLTGYGRISSRGILNRPAGRQRWCHWFRLEDAGTVRRPVMVTPCDHDHLDERRGVSAELRDASRELFEGLTRGQLVRYYERLAAVLVPHLRDRAFVVLFGARPGKRGTFLKDVPSGAPAWLPRAALPAASRGGKPVVAPVVCDAADLLWLVCRGVIELHVTLHRVDEPQRPDVVLFDLDRTPGASFDDVAMIALPLRDALAGVG